MRLRVALVLLVVVSLAGCGVAPLPAPSPTPTAGSSVVEPPLPALPLACGDIVTSSTLAAFAGEVVPVHRDAGSTPDSWYEVAKRQHQILTCVWSADRDLAPLTVIAIPNAATDFAAYRAGLVPNHYDRLDVVGDQSVHQCGYGQCRFEVLIGDFWVSGFANRPTMMDDADLEPLFLPVLTEIAAAIEAGLSERREPWEVPAGVLTGWGAGCDDTAPVADLAAALGVSNPVVASPLESDGGAWGLVTSRIAVPHCTLLNPGTSTYLGEAVVVEGGAWVTAEWAIQPPAQWDSGFYEPVEVDGVGVVYLGDEGSRWDAYVPIEGSLAWFSVEGGTREAFLAALAAAATVVGDHG
ncbi:hypothetical protein [Pseudolysinimonas yzui]|uniref:DUF3558 domain-containing protein n=1 Tax=Pseudolysinimonas yzui TaxID=2708254 RepID=A0A8J3M045_9MICO|nr:hypothetical protein [Pseudolysinimonas yzui]GHF15571.1 hypothetical protein GCM10011600_15740 [Pseudolysinimonas yzui]